MAFKNNFADKILSFSDSVFKLSSLPILILSSNNKSPVSSPSFIFIIPTPVNSSPFISDHWIGAAPRHLGSNEAIEISQKIKGLYPRANTTFRGKNLKILKIKVLSSDEIKNEKYLFMSNYSRPGIILAVIENEGIIISTKTDPIILLEAKLEGKNISSKKQLIQQLKPSVGEYLSD